MIVSLNFLLLKLPITLNCGRATPLDVPQNLLRLARQLRLAAGQPDRGEISELLDWYQNQLEKTQVQIKLRTEMTADKYHFPSG